MRLALLALLVGACGNTFQPATLIDLTCAEPPCKIRLLGVRADPPDVGANQSTTLTALAVDAAEQPIEIDWSRCDKRAPTGSNAAVDPDCLHQPPQPFLTPIGSGTSVMMTMPAIPIGMLGLADSTYGFYLPVVMHLRADDRTADSVERVRINIGLPPNHNPEFANLFVVPPSTDATPADPVPIDEANPPSVRLGEDLTLRATFTPDSAESYQVFDGDPRQGVSPRDTVELPRVNWYSTGGTFGQEVTDEERPDTVLHTKKYVPSSVPPEGTLIDLYAIGRDGRGGTAFAKRQVRLVP